MRIFKHTNPQFKTKILDFTYTSQPSINSALPLKINTIKMVFFIIGCFFTSGFLWLISKWSSKKKAILLYDVCQIGQATSFLIQEEDIIGGSLIVERSNVLDVKRKTMSVSFCYHQRTYLYHEQKQVFLPIRYQELGQQLDKLKKGRYQPYSQKMRNKLLEYYGYNTINLPIQTKLQVFIEQMLTPYQVFQLYAIILWIYEEYYIFSFLLFGYSLYCYWTYSQQAIKNQKKLRDQSLFQLPCKVAYKTNKKPQDFQNQQNDSQEYTIMDQPINLDQIEQKTPNSQNKMKDQQKIFNLNQQLENQHKVEHQMPNKKISHLEKISHGCLDLEFQDISSNQILPGDIIILQQGDVIPCDCILIHGQALVNEKYISGQDYLIRKQQIQRYTYHKQKQKSFLLYLGTILTKVRGKGGNWQVNTSQLDTGRYHTDINHSINESVREKVQTSRLDSINFADILHPQQIACLVSQTNYNTQRGKYLRAVRYQKKPVLNFTRQTILFLYIIIAITIIGYLAIFHRIKQGQTSWNLFIILLDLAGDSIPMTLPAILSMGISFAQHRLSKNGVYSVLPSNILAGGLADTLVLDSQQIFGKKLETSSITIGRKDTGEVGRTFSSMQQFLEFSSMSSLSQSFHNDPIKKQKQVSQQQYKGKMMLKSFALCHTLEKYNQQLNGSEEEKSLFQFSEGKYVREDCYQILNQVYQVTERVYFKEKEHKFGVVVQLLETAEQVIGQKNVQKSFQQINHSLLDDQNIQITKNAKKQQQIQHIKSDESIAYQYKRKKQYILIKGSPQKIIKICRPETCPNDINDYIVDMAEKGFNLIGYAYKELYADQIDQKCIKRDYILSGFAALKKQKQIDTVKTIDNLKKSHLKMLLISYHRQLQATSEAIQNNLCTKNELLLCSEHHDRIFCKGHIEWESSLDSNDAINQFLEESKTLAKHSKVSLTSKLYESLYMKKQESEESEQLFKKTVIFNQMENKHSRNLYFQLQKKGYVTFAVGNGSSVSECAHLSLQLDRGECSLVSSFHTQNKTLSCITQCLIICRAALATNFHAFGMMVHFSLIQFTTVLLLQYHYQAITDSQMLYQDLFVTFPIFITINMTKPARKLSKQLPPKSFFSLRPLISTIGQLIIQFVVQLAFILYLFTMDVFAKQLEASKQYYLENQEFKTTQVSLSLFIITNYLYLGIVLSTSVSQPFRKPFYTNPYYTATLIILWLYNTIIVMAPSLAPGSIRKQDLSEQTQEMLVISMLLGNLVMVCMYMYQKFLQWIWSCYWGQKISSQNQRSQMIEQH